MFGKPKKKISLESAILAGEMKEVRRSLESGTDPNQPISDERGGYPLHFAVNSSIEIIQMLIEHGADVNVKDAKGRTPLHIVAASKPTIEKMELLIENGADVNAVDNEGKTPLASVLQGTPVNSFFATLGVSPDEEETELRNNASDFLRAHGAK
ncbi:MAG: hypothetical protein GYA18_03435 [Chloroflexi bacterium]|nr:hypothetical protein [Chloroflexota bacterium]